MQAQLAFSQLCFPVKKAYAYFQPVTAGTMAKSEAKNRKQGGNYLVYLTSSSTGISLKNTWINGELQHADLLEVQPPVYFPSATATTVSDSRAKDKTLVPATKRKTYQLIFTAFDSSTARPALPVKYNSKPVVLEIQYKNKTKFITLDKITELDILPLY